MNSPPSLNRRRFLQGSAAAAGALAATRPATSSAVDRATLPSPGRVIDCHAHLHHASVSNFREKDRQLIEAADKLGIEISRLSALLDNVMGQLIAKLGPDRLVFGTGMPFTYPDPSLLKLDVLDAAEDVKERVRWKNAVTMLGI